jgi:hypothetical protein
MGKVTPLANYFMSESSLIDLALFWKKIVTFGGLGQIWGNLS